MVTNNDLERFKIIGRVRIYNDNLGHKYQRKTHKLYLSFVESIQQYIYMWTKVRVGIGQYVKKKRVSIGLQIRYEKGLYASNGHKLQMKI